MKLTHNITFGTAAIIIALASQAKATVVTFDSFGGSYPLYTTPPGETLYTDFSTGLPGGAAGNGGLYTVPSGDSAISPSSGNYVAPPWTSSGGTTQQFFATLPNQSETFTFSTSVEDVGVYIGSLDNENSLTLNYVGGSSQTWTGAQLATISGYGNISGNDVNNICSGDCTIMGSTTNGRWTFTDSSPDIVSITVAEGSAVSSNSFEIAQITTSVPEPSTWAMMMLGFAGLGFAGYQAKRKSVAA